MFLYFFWSESVIIFLFYWVHHNRTGVSASTMAAMAAVCIVGAQLL